MSVTQLENGDLDLGEGRVLRTDATPMVRIGAAIVAIGFGGFVLWASFAELKQAAIAPGVLVVESKRRAIQHLEGGMVGAIRAREGDFVAAGDVLLELSDVRAGSTRDQVAAQLVTVLAQRDRLLAEREQLGAPVFSVEGAGDPVAQSAIAAQVQLFQSRSAALAARDAVFTTQIRQIAEDKTAAEAILDANRRSLAIIADERQGLEELLRKGFTSRSRVLALRRQQAELEGKIAEQQARLGALAERRAEINEERRSTQLEFLNSVNDELQQAEQRVRELEASAASAEDVFSRVQIRAPQDGVIVGLNVSTIGQVISPGETLMEIVPQDDDLIVEALMKPEDIDVVRVGLPAQVRLTAYSFRMVPPLDGEVVYVSADRVTDERTNSSAYLVRVVLTAEVDKSVELLPGMSAETVIVTGQTTPMAYLLDPIAQTLTFGMTEN